MPPIAHLFFRTAIVFLLVGVTLGLVMSISQNHDAGGAHAHINLIGWVTSALYGGYFALNPAKASGLLPRALYGIHTVGAAVMTGGLYFLLTTGNAAATPFVAVGSMIVALGVLIAAFVIWSPDRG